ncbi:MAG: hypothetical protein DWQ10_06060, partial [Calditrichaeota bacterium]
MHLTNEDQLLILGARAHHDKDSKDSIKKLLQKHLDWDYLVSASIQHSTALLLYNALKLATDDFKQSKNGIPENTKFELETLYLNNRKRTARMQNVLAEIFSKFAEYKIDVLALKEVGLIHFIYPDSNLHPIGDLDLLIHKSDFKTAEKCLIDLGYSTLPTSDCHYRMSYLDGFQFHRESDNTWLDIQWNVENKSKDISGKSPVNFQIDRMWKNAQLIELAGHEVRMACPSDMIFHLCLHLEGHGYTELILLTDIAEAINYYNGKLDWDKLIYLTQKFSMQTTIYYALLWVKKLFCISVPAKVFEQISPSFCKAFFFESVFSNLGTLHNYADEIDMIANPPQHVRKNFEIIVRRQASSSVQVYKIVDDIMREFSDIGGQYIHLDGEPSHVILPSKSLPTFNPLQLIISANEISLLATSLENSGFSEQETNWVKDVAFRSSDPIIENISINMVVKWRLETDKTKLFDSLLRTRPTKKDLAKYIIKNRNSANSHFDQNVEISINIYALQPEEILAFICAETGQIQNRKLLAACYLFDFFKAFSEKRDFDWELFVDTMYAHFPQFIPQSYSSLKFASS